MAPSLLVVPGSFSPAQMYDDLLDKVRELAPVTKAYVSNLPSATRTAPQKPATLSDDAEHFRSILKILCDEQGEDVVLMAHSYGGVVATETVTENWGKEAREKAGKKGGVSRIVFLASRCPPMGESTVTETGMPPKEFVGTDEVCLLFRAR
jgi:pimeloyl-ACP methyl ester carboxylesterase